MSSGGVCSVSGGALKETGEAWNRIGGALNDRQELGFLSQELEM
jgi:hypothetical protein